MDEMEANLFAAELLMPLSFLTADVTKLVVDQKSTEKKIEKLAKRYEVSQQALTVRLTSIGYIQQ